jgi:HlyD family secretion protein
MLKKFLGAAGIGAMSLILVIAGVRMVRLDSSASAKYAPAALEEPAPATIGVACPGRIEGRSETIAVGAAVDGIVQAIHVREGQRVYRGQPLAEIGCSDLEASLKVALAEADSLRQARVRLLRGSREEERQTAAQKTAAARAVVEQAAAHAGRMQKLWDANAASRAVFEESRRDYEVAEAALKQAMRNEELINAGPLAEEVARADADVQAAEGRIKLAEDRLGKCVVRAPISGTILRVSLRQGESFALLSPKPLFQMADTSSRRVRAEVDERDVGSIRVGQKIVVTSDAYQGKRFSGTIHELSSIMGRKSIDTGNPADKSDRDILEVIAELEPDAVELPLGLRVTVQVLPPQ